MRTAIVLFRASDLRLLDHEPLVKAHASFDRVLHLFCFDPRSFGRSRVAGFPRVGPLRARFLLESVDDLRAALRERGSDLVLRTGRPDIIVPAFAAAVRADLVLAHADCNVEENASDAALRAALGTATPLELLWGGQTLYHPSDVPAASPHALPDNFSAFRRAAESNARIRAALGVPEVLRAAPAGWDTAASEEPPSFPLTSNNLRAIGANAGAGLRPSPAALGAADNSALLSALGGGGGGAAPIANANATAIVTSASASGTLDDGAPADIFGYLPHDDGITPPDPRSGMCYQGGERAALARLESWVFKGDHLKDYKETRNGLLGADYSSKLSPWLALGCVSPRTVAAAVAKYEASREKNDSTYWLLFELLWRDFMRFYARKNGAALYRAGGPRGKEAVWKRDAAAESAWARGVTGYPFVDAAMRELLTTGFQSNRMRQNVASFLAKDIAVDWRVGAEWFEATLLDHDAASNWGNWTYVAGVGSDPREDRYFLLTKQSKTYDPDTAFIRSWVPELSAAPNGSLHDPRSLTSVLRGRAYPTPIVELLAWREPRGGEGGGGGVGGGSGGGGSGGGCGGARGGRGGGRGGGGGRVRGGHGGRGRGGHGGSGNDRHGEAPGNGHYKTGNVTYEKA